MPASRGLLRPAHQMGSDNAVLTPDTPDEFWIQPILTLCSLGTRRRVRLSSVSASVPWWARSPQGAALHLFPRGSLGHRRCSHTGAFRARFHHGGSHGPSLSWIAPPGFRLLPDFG